MASKLYPTLSAFYKAENVGFGSENDLAMLSAVPDEKLYRKRPRQRTDLPMRKTEHTKNTTILKEAPYNNVSSSVKPNGDVNVQQNVHVTDTPDLTSPADDDVFVPSPPLTPTAPPLLEMLDARIQQYLDALLVSNREAGMGVPAAASADVPPQNGLGASTILDTTALPPNVLLEDPWSDELAPDYDDQLAAEEIADEILNNLDVASSDPDPKAREKSLTLIRLGLGLGFDSQDSERKIEKHHNSHFSQDKNITRDKQETHTRKPHFYKQTSKNSIENNENIESHQCNRQRHSRHNHNNHDHVDPPKSRPMLRSSPAGDRQHDRAEFSRETRPRHHSERTNILPQTTYETEYEKFTNLRSSGLEYPPQRSGQKRNGERRRSTAKPPAAAHHEMGGSCMDLRVYEHKERHRRRSGEKTSGEPVAANENEHRPGRARQQGESSDYNAWMTWRKQVNRQLATIILLKQQGRKVCVQNTDMRRKPLRQSSIDFVSQIATQTGSSTSLGGKPYVMYGIPRASLLGGSTTNINKKDR